jgi:CubicO group peptidase (beta-lactamase class C family)
MVKRASAVVVVVAVLVCGAGAAGGRWSLTKDQAAADGVETLERAIEQELSRRGGVGATVAVVQDGRPLLAKGFGRRSADSPARVDESTLFGMGSVTKQFTAAAALLLAEQGKLSVMDKSPSTIRA